LTSVEPPKGRVNPLREILSKQCNKSILGSQFRQGIAILFLYIYGLFSSGIVTAAIVKRNTLERDLNTPAAEVNAPADKDEHPGAIP